MSSLPPGGGGSGWGGRSRKQPNGHRCPVGEDSRRPSRRSAEHLPLVPPTLTLPLRGGGDVLAGPGRPPGGRGGGAGWGGGPAAPGAGGGAAGRPRPGRGRGGPPP